MLTIFCAVLFCPLAFLGGWKIGVLAVVIGLAAILLPIEGFHKQELVKIESLIKLKRSTTGDTGDNCYYVQKLGKKVIYAFDDRRRYELEGVAYEEKIVRGKIKIYESPDCTQPVLKVYKAEPKTELFTFAPFSTKTEYIFNVPEGTFLEDKTNKCDLPDNIV